MPQYIDAVEATIRMTKSEGELPDLSGMKASAIKKLIALSVDGETLKELGYTHYRVIKGGEKSDTLNVSDGAIDGYPTLKVRIYRYPDFMGNKADVFYKDRATLGSAFSYRIPSGDGNFFFIDANGYTEPVRVNSEMKPPEFFDEKLRSKCTEV